MKIVVLSTMADGPCGWWRITRPLELMKKKFDIKYECVKLDFNGDVNIDIKGAIVILHRLILTNPKEYINQLRKAGAVRIIFELDDDMLSSNYSDYIRACGRYSDAGLQKVANNRSLSIIAINECDAITVSTNHLASLVCSFTSKPVYVIQNSIDVDWFESRLKQYDSNGVVTIGWAGGLRPNADLEVLGKAWSILKGKYKEDIQFIVAGWQADALYEHLDVEDVVRRKWADLDNWPSNMQMDIGCIGLQHTNFNLCKSTIKYFEYTLAGAVTVAPPNVYSDVIVDKVTGCLADTVHTYVDSISYLIEDENRRKQILKSAQYNVKKYHSLEYNVQDWYNVYERISS